MANRKGEGIPIPDVIDPPESMTVTLCVPKNTMHLAAFFGALYQLTIWTSWQRNDTTQGVEVASVWNRYFSAWNKSINDIECEDGMATCCIEAAIIKRINPTTGNVEQSTDGGVTWTPVSGGIQSVIVQPVPPVTSGVAETKCDAATNVAGQVDVWIDQVSNDFTTATSLLEFGVAVLIAILSAVLVVLSAGALTPLEALVLPTIGAALAAAWGAGKAVFDAYWTTEVKDAILCAAYCHIGADGSFTDGQFSAFWNNVNADLPPSPAKMLFMGFLSSVGRAGLNAMAASGMAANSDCADCTACLTCTDRFDIYCDAGTNLTRHEGYIEITSTLSSLTGSQSVALSTGLTDSGCYVCGLTDENGTPISSPLTAYVPVGEAVPSCGGAFGHSGFIGQLVNTLLVYNNSTSAVFTARLYLSDEPCP